MPEKEDEEIKAVGKDTKNGKWSHFGEFIKAVAATCRGGFDPRLEWLSGDSEKSRGQKECPH